MSGCYSYLEAGSRSWSLDQRELFSRTVLSDFPKEMKVSHDPKLEVLRFPIDDPIFCARFLAQRHAKAAKLLVTVGSLDPQVALLLLRQYAGYCKLVHLARLTPPSLISNGLALFDADIRFCSECTRIDTADND